MFGMLNVNKPAGWTSRDVVNHVNRMVGRKIKVGHAGTLDPLATGVLLVCIGNATKLVPWIHDSLKSYRATFQLGIASPTDDIESETEEVFCPDLRAEEIENVLPQFTGKIQQIPPIFSAVKVNGKRAYLSARQGEVVEIPSREVFINRLTLHDFTAPHFTLDVECGSGTYMRSLGRDIARVLDTEAVMTGLVRTNVGRFDLSTAVDLAALSRDNITESLLNPVGLFETLPLVVVDNWTAQRIIWGQAIPNPQIEVWSSGDHVVLQKEDGHFLGLAKVEGPRLLSQIVFIPEGHIPLRSPEEAAENKSEVTTEENSSR